MTPPMFGPPLGVRDPFLNPESAPPLPEMSPGPDVDPGSPVPATSSPGFTDLSKRKATVKVCKEVFGGILKMSSGLLNTWLALDEDDETWLMDPEEVSSIALPVARIIARRVPAIPEGADSSSSDLLDGVTAVVGIFGYGLRCLMQRAETKIAQRRDIQRFYAAPADHDQQPADVDPGPVPPAAAPASPYGRPFVPYVPPQAGPPIV